MKKAIVVGSGFAGLASSAILAKEGHDVTLLEKNDQVGGRARQFEEQGFVFDMGPSWYWMPDVFEDYFKLFNKKPSDYFELKKLDPAFQIFFDNDKVEVSGEPHGVYELFEKLEPGSSKRLDEFMREAEFKYNIGVKDIIYRQPDGIKPFLDWKVIKSATRLQLLSSMSKHVRKYFKHPYIHQILEFPVLFLGADPKNTPALYSMMDYAGLMMGTWYPIGGFHKVIDAMRSIAQEQGVIIKTSTNVTGIKTNYNRCVAIESNEQTFEADSMVMSMDYHHFDSIIAPEHQQYSDKYWESRDMAPSSLLYYVGHKGKVDGLQHHNLFFDTSFEKHSDEIYKSKEWPADPLFYVCCPSKTDPLVAPEGDENLFILIPIAAGLSDTDELKEKYFDLVCDRIKNKIGTDIRSNMVFKRDYSSRDFIKDYNAYKGNAYGLANTLRQTAFLKPSMKHKKLKNLFFSGQLTVPGPGVPPSLISGQLAAKYATEYLKNLT